MCIYDVYRYFEMLNCIIGIFFDIFPVKCFTLGAKRRKIFSRKMLLHARSNTKNTFLVYFLEPKQTYENIFLFVKYFQLKIFYTRKIFYMLPNTTLVFLHFPKWFYCFPFQNFQWYWLLLFLIDLELLMQFYLAYHCCGNS